MLLQCATHLGGANSAPGEHSSSGRGGFTVPSGAEVSSRGLRASVGAWEVDADGISSSAEARRVWKVTCDPRTTRNTPSSTWASDRAACPPKKGLRMRGGTPGPPMSGCQKYAVAVPREERELTNINYYRIQYMQQHAGGAPDTIQLSSDV